MRKKYVVRLTADERARLRRLLTAGTAATRKVAHARILLKADQGPNGPAWADARIAATLEVSRPTVERVRKRCVEEGLEVALGHRSPRATKPRALDGHQEAQFIALSCSGPPPGRERWSLRLLANKLVEFRVVDSVSHETVRQVLQQPR